MEASKDPHHEEVEVRHHTLLQRDWRRVAKPVAIGASKLPNLLSSHHTANGKDIHKPVGDILWTDNWECRLGRPDSCLQHLLDCTVLLEERRSINLLDSVGLGHDYSTVFISGWLISMGNYRCNPKWKGVSGNLFLPFSHRDNKLEHVDLNCSILIRYLLIALMGQSNISSASPSTKSAKDGKVNSSMHESYTESFCFLATKSGRKEKVQDLQPLEYLTIGETMQLANPFGRRKNYRKTSFPGQMFIRRRLHGLICLTNKAPQNQRQIPS